MKMNKKFIIVFLVLLLVIIVSLTIIYKYKLSNTENNEISTKNAEDKELLEDANTNLNVLEQNTLASLENEEKNIVKTEEITKTENTQKAEKNNITNQDQKKTTEKSVKKETSPITSQEVVSSQPVTITKPVEQPKVEVAPTPEVPAQPVVQAPVVAPTEEYRYNDAMTQTIINIINSNPSQYMQTDGYNVVVDSSITSLTNQFTFTEERVKNKILYKAGTIKVYAQDYYNNGELLFTECYIF